MDANNVVTWACDNQGTLTQILAWMGGIMPVMSVVTWVTAKWNLLPNFAQRVLQVTAGNALHAALGEPKKV